MGVRIGIDTGGTFTDLIGLDESTGELGLAKKPAIRSPVVRRAEPAGSPRILARRVGHGFGEGQPVERNTKGYGISDLLRHRRRALRNWRWPRMRALVGFRGAAGDARLTSNQGKEHG
jgi:Hydantoinase/oxoprolinase N-terminal region